MLNQRNIQLEKSFSQELEIRTCTMCVLRTFLNKTCFAIFENDVKRIWHKRLRHVNMKTISKSSNSELVLKVCPKSNLKRIRSVKHVFMANIPNLVFIQKTWFQLRNLLSFYMLIYLVLSKPWVLEGKNMEPWVLEGKDMDLLYSG